MPHPDRFKRIGDGAGAEVALPLLASRRLLQGLDCHSKLAVQTASWVSVYVATKICEFYAIS